MHRLLPFAFLLMCASIFGIFWIVFEVDPDPKPIHLFALFSFLVFSAIWMGFGTFLYFARTRLYRKYEPNWYFKTSFKMAFFVALFLGLQSFLVLMDLINLFNFFLVIVIILLFAFYFYLGKKHRS